MSEVLQRRLMSDYQKVKTLAANSQGRLVVGDTVGNPPTEYVITYHCIGVEKLVGGKAVYRTEHQLQFRLGSDYPAIPPTIKVITPIFHPHVWPDQRFCLRDHMNKMEFYHVSEFLDRLVLRIGAMIQLDPQYIAERSPANSQAMQWFEKNKHQMPLDTQTFSNFPKPGPVPTSWRNLP